MENIIFGCPHCNRVFKLKHHLKAHLQRKKSCSLIKNKNTLIESFTHSNPYTCRHCNRKFKRNWGLKRHLTTCKKKKEKDNTEKELLEAKIKIKKLEIQNKQLLLNKINTQNNITTNNNCHNTLNFVFNDYGNENIESFKDIKYKKLIAQILGNGMNGLQKYIKYKYCNPNIPENLTIKYTNDRSDKLKIRQNNKWKTCDKNEILDELYDRDNNIEEVLNVYENINDLEDVEEMDELQVYFVDEIDKFYNDNEDEDADKEVKEEMKRIKKITLNDFYDCYKQNKVKFGIKNTN